MNWLKKLLHVFKKPNRHQYANPDKGLQPAKNPPAMPKVAPAKSEPAAGPVAANTAKPKKPTKAQLNKLTKKKLEALGREHNVELDLRLRKDKLVDQLHKAIK